MTGWAQTETSAVVVKGTSGVVVLAGDLVDRREERECVRCAKCVEVCPMFLMPNFIVQYPQGTVGQGGDVGRAGLLRVRLLLLRLPRLHPARAIRP